MCRSPERNDRVVSLFLFLLSMSYPLETRRHSAAHVMAAAIKRLFPQAKFGVGPVIENGFYYDIDLGRSLSQEDLQAIDAEMQKICKENPAFVKETVSLEEAIQRFSAAGQTYKVELLNDLKTRGTTKVGEDLAQEVDPAAVGEVTVYQTGDFMDLCRGPHVANAKEIGAWKLTKIAGAYWRGKDTNPQMQRIYGLCFATAEELAAHVKMIEEAEKRDHRRLGAELELFTFDDQVGPGLPLWMPNGTAIIQRLEELAFEAEEKGGYVRVRTPHIAKEQLYLTSGHLPYYKDSMFPPMEMDGERYYLKAMNCPHHHKLFSARPRSYRELPLRLAEYGTCYRYEDSGSLFGLMRVRSLQMNDAHIYCTPEQFRSEFLAVIDLYKYYFKLFGISKFEMRLSKHAPEKLGEKYVNEPELWIKTEAEVRSVLQESGVPFFEAEDEAAFYGPKIDVQIWSAIGREFTLATNQLDFAVPKRFGLEYVDSDGQRKTPLCIHRAPLSTHERFIGFLIEHYAGSFPLWLAPTQIAILPVADRHIAFAQELKKELVAEGFRVSVDDSTESVGKKIRASEHMKYPIALVVGDKEANGEPLTVRIRGQKDQASMEKEAFKAFIREQVQTKAGTQV